MTVDDTISRQAAIDALAKHEKSKGHNYTLFVDIVSECAEIIRDLPSAQPERKWIPCSERLPEEEKKTYWVCTDAEYQCECRWTDVNPFWTDLTTDWHWHRMDIPQYTKVVAWRELPEPYKENKE